MSGKVPIFAGLTPRASRQVRRLVSVILDRFRVLERWAKEAARAAEENKSMFECMFDESEPVCKTWSSLHHYTLHEKGSVQELIDLALTCQHESERASYTTEVTSRRMMWARLFMRFSFFDQMTTDEWVTNWRNINTTWAWAIVTQEDTETAAVGRIERAHFQVDHKAWRQLVSRATSTPLGTFVDLGTIVDLNTLPINQASYRAVLYSTIVCTIYKDLMFSVDALDHILGRPGQESKSQTDISVPNTIRTLQRGAEHVVPKEVVRDHLKEFIFAELQQVVIEYLFFTPAVVVAGISETGLFVRFYTTPSRFSPSGMEVLPLRSCFTLVPVLAVGEKVWIETPLRLNDCCWVPPQVNYVERRVASDPQDVPQIDRDVTERTYPWGGAFKKKRKASSLAEKHN